MLEIGQPDGGRSTAALMIMEAGNETEEGGQVRSGRVAAYQGVNGGTLNLTTIDIERMHRPYERLEAHR